MSRNLSNVNWNSICKNCLHNHSLLGMCCAAGKIYFGCECNDWIPSDNLEYLEYMNEKKSKV